MFVLKPLHRAIWIAVFAGVAMSVLVWIAWNDPAINFLPRDRRAEWIVFPAAVSPPQATAYAETGDFPRAISVAEEALNRARGSGDNDAVKQTESILASLRYSLPYARNRSNNLFLS
jgi:hypothetical protein